MRIQTAVIMAAGMGTRLKALGQSVPKGFLRLGERPIIEESVEKLRQCGIRRIIIITGHLSDYYRRLQERYGPLVITVHNPLYAESGSMYSLYCARDLIDGDFLLLESDLIYERRALEAVISFPKDDVILLSHRTDAGDEVYVETSGGTIIAMSKNKAELGEEIAGELVGISKISRPLFQIMLEKATSLFKNSLKVDYETDALVAAAENYLIYYTVVPDLLWAEIDDENHLLRAKQQIYPAIIN
jgi:2-aminoethylphosphonate-pyruvate transaminase